MTPLRRGVHVRQTACVMSDKRHLSIVVPTRNKAGRLRICLRMLAHAILKSRVPSEVIVVDDGSNDETASVLNCSRRRFGIPARVIRVNSQTGRSAARNKGASVASGQWLLFLDDDVLIDEVGLSRHFEAQANSQTLTIARGTILNLPWFRMLADPSMLVGTSQPNLTRRLSGVDWNVVGLDQLKPLARRSRFEADIHRLLYSKADIETGRWLAVTGGNLSVSFEAFVQIGGFDESFGLRWGLEDLEFGFRAEKADTMILHLSDVVVYHLDHELVNRIDDQRVGIQYFAKKHGHDIGEWLKSYFEGTVDITEVPS